VVLFAFHTRAALWNIGKRWKRKVNKKGCQVPYSKCHLKFY
jgi:hypothetical protein